MAVEQLRDFVKETGEVGASRRSREMLVIIDMEHVAEKGVGGNGPAE